MKATVPVGAADVPGEVSLTVAAQVVDRPTATDPGEQERLVLDAR